MASELRRVLGVSAAPLPADGRGLVRYMGGRAAAVRTLTGMDHRPRRADYGKGERGDARHAADLTRWKSAQQRVRRWDEGLRGTKDAGKHLTATERRRAQAADRARKRAHIATAGLAMRIHGVIRWPSPGGSGDTRVRTIPLGGPGEVLGDGMPGGPAAAAAEVLAALRESEEAAIAVALERFMDQTDLHAGLAPSGLVRLWPANENEPAEPSFD